MSRGDTERLADLLEAAQEVERLVKEGHDEYLSNHFLQLALERLLQIIGEAARTLSAEFRSRYPSVPWSEVIGFRVLLVHYYHRVDSDLVWKIATEDVPELMKQLQRPAT